MEVTAATEPTLEDLFADLVRAKQAEKEANARRLACEERILATIADKPEKGRVKLEGGPVTATVEFKLNYKADVDALLALTDAHELPLKRVEAHYEFDAKAYEAIRASKPDLYVRLSRHVEVKPAKPSFDLKL